MVCEATGKTEATTKLQLLVVHRSAFFVCACVQVYVFSMECVCVCVCEVSLFTHLCQIIPDLHRFLQSYSH